MAKRMTLRDGRQVGADSGSEEEREERSHGMGDYPAVYMEQGQQVEGDAQEEDLTDGEAVEQEDRTQEMQNRRSRDDNNDTMMQILISMKEDMKKMNGKMDNMEKNMRGDMNKMDGKMDNMKDDLNGNINRIEGSLNGKMDKINGNMNKLEKKIEEVKTESIQEFRKLREENEECRQQINKVKEDMVEQNKHIRIEIQENGMKIREQIENQVVEQIQEIERGIEEKLPGTIQAEVIKQTEDITKEMEYMKFREQTIEEIMQNYQQNAEHKFKELDIKFQKQTGTCEERNEHIGQIFHKELEEMNRKLQEGMEEIEFKVRRDGGGVIYTGNMDIGVKFDGNINTIHPKVFIKIIKSKLKEIKKETGEVGYIKLQGQVLETALGSLKENSFIVSRESAQLDFDLCSSKINDYTIFTIHKTPEETIVLLRKKSKSKELFTIDVSSSEKLDWIQSLQNVIKTNPSDNVVLYAQNRPLSGILGFVNCIRREPETSNIRALFVMDHAEDFDKDGSFYKQQLDKNMAINIRKNNTWGTYRHLPLEHLENIKTEHCFVNTTIRGDLSSLKWIENNLKRDTIAPFDKKLVHVHYASLNFRDVMTATGKINVDVITNDRLEQEIITGFEFSGYTSDGRRIMGMKVCGGMSTLTLADEYLLIDVPDTMSLKEAATIPIVYSTVIYGLLLRTKLRKGETILIHSGSGGVGQAAIRIALYYGCTVFTTVGTAEKREFLLKTFPQLKAEQIGNSRDLSFERMVRKYTRSRGVDVILNSLAEEKLQASIRCLARGGRFMEIGKFDFGNNSMLRMSLLKREASFHGIMLDELFKCSPETKMELFDILKSHMGKCILPLPVTSFSYNQVEEAFRYMSTGNHIGKVMIQVREEERVPQLFPEKFVGLPRYFCDSQKTYIIVGGLGGFGLELADWLVLRGAKNLVLTSRKGITTGYQRSRIRTWESYGTVVHISTEDVCTEEGCRNLLQEASKLGEVNSIFNLAVVLADAIFENQTEETFKTSLGPKAVATDHLDKLSRILCPELKDFVVFSSVSCGRGNAGQTNYGMANSIMERICEQRKIDGYPALAIQWGAIGDVGLVAELQEEHVNLEIGGTLQQKISSCLNLLNNLLRQKNVTIVSSIVVAEKRGGFNSCDNVVDTVLTILGISDANVVSAHATLPELGMDSMTGVEIKQTLEREFEIFLTPKEMKSITLAKLKAIQEKRCLGVEEKETEVVDLDFMFNNVSEEEVRTAEVVLKSNISEEADGPTVLIFPGIEGYGKVFSQMAMHLDAHVVAYQYWERIDFKTVEEIVQSLLPRVQQRLRKNKRFNIIGFSIGSLIASEIVKNLESMDYTGKLIIIDGGSELIQKLLQGYKQYSDEIFETNLACQILTFYVSGNVISRTKETILNCSNWNERLKVVEGIMKQVGTHPETVAFHRMLANGIYNRLKICEHYTQSFDKLKTEITLFKPSIQAFKDIDDDYGISKITDSPVDIKVFEGNHSNIIENELLAKEVNSLIQK